MESIDKICFCFPSCSLVFCQRTTTCLSTITHPPSRSVLKPFMLLCPHQWYLTFTPSSDLLLPQVWWQPCQAECWHQCCRAAYDCTAAGNERPQIGGGHKATRSGCQGQRQFNAADKWIGKSDVSYANRFDHKTDKYWNKKGEKHHKIKMMLFWLNWKNYWLLLSVEIW